MTDPRLLKCAQALMNGVKDGLGYEDLSLACILKWLEQNPSDGMATIGGDNMDYDDSPHDKADANNAAISGIVYTAMNAQATKELKGE